MVGRGQGSLFGDGDQDEPSRDARSVLFLAAIPDAATADRIYRLAQRLRQARGLRGEPIRPDRLHVSLLGLADAGEPCGQIVADTSATATRPGIAPFSLTFDRTVSFRSTRNRPFVLLAGDGADRLRALRDALLGTARRSGAARGISPHFTPHVTLLYDRQDIEELPVEPISWIVRDVVLVRSDQGLGRHRHVARWMLHAS